MVSRPHGQGYCAEFASIFGLLTSSSRSSMHASPRSGRNPVLDELAAEKTRVVALDRDDLANPASTKLWLREFSLRGYTAIAVDGRNPRSVARIAAAIVPASGRRKGQGGVSRAMIVGIPNSGKSTIVNALLRRAAAKTEDARRRDPASAVVPSLSRRSNSWIRPAFFRRESRRRRRNGGSRICGAVPQRSL